MQHIFLSKTRLRSDHLLAIDNDFCCHSVYFLHFDDNMLANVFPVLNTIQWGISTTHIEKTVPYSREFVPHSLIRERCPWLLL